MSGPCENCGLEIFDAWEVDIQAPFQKAKEEGGKEDPGVRVKDPGGPWGSCRFCQKTFYSKKDYYDHARARSILSNILISSSPSRGEEEPAQITIEAQDGQPGVIKHPKYHARSLPLNMQKWMLMNSTPICRILAMLSRFGVAFCQRLFKNRLGSAETLAEETRKSLLGQGGDFDHQSFLDGKPRPGQRTTQRSLKDVCAFLRCNVETVVASLFPGHFVTYQEEFDFMRLRSGQYFTYVHEDHTLQHRNCCYKNTNVTGLTVWVATSGCGPDGGLSFWFPDPTSRIASNKSVGIMAEDDLQAGWWGSVFAEPGSAFFFFENTLHTTFNSEADKGFRGSVEFRFFIQPPPGLVKEIWNPPEKFQLHEVRQINWDPDPDIDHYVCTLCVLDRPEEPNRLAQVRELPLYRERDPQRKAAGEVQKREDRRRARRGLLPLVHPAARPPPHVHGDLGGGCGPAPAPAHPPPSSSTLYPHYPDHQHQPSPPPPQGPPYSPDSSHTEGHQQHPPPPPSQIYDYPPPPNQPPPRDTHPAPHSHQPPLDPPHSPAHAQDQSHHMHHAPPHHGQHPQHYPPPPEPLPHPHPPPGHFAEAPPHANEPLQPGPPPGPPPGSDGIVPMGGFLDSLHSPPLVPDGTPASVAASGHAGAFTHGAEWEKGDWVRPH